MTCRDYGVDQDKRNVSIRNRGHIPSTTRLERFNNSLLNVSNILKKGKVKAMSKAKLPVQVASSNLSEWRLEWGRSENVRTTELYSRSHMSSFGRQWWRHWQVVNDNTFVIFAYNWLAFKIEGKAIKRRWTVCRNVKSTRKRNDLPLCVMMVVSGRHWLPCGSNSIAWMSLFFQTILVKKSHLTWDRMLFEELCTKGDPLASVRWQPIAKLPEFLGKETVVVLQQEIEANISNKMPLFSLVKQSTGPFLWRSAW